MANGTVADFVVYNEQAHSGMTEAIARNLALFNNDSSNAIRLLDNDMLGFLSQDSFFKRTQLIKNRNPLVKDPVDPCCVDMDEHVGVKVHGGTCPLHYTTDQWRKIGERPGRPERWFGEQFGEQAVEYMLDTAIAAVANAIRAQDAAQDALSGAGDYCVIDQSSNGANPGNITKNSLLSAISLFGDQSSKIVAWVMHSAHYFKLVEEQLGECCLETSALALRTGTALTLGKPVYIVDSPALVDTVTDANETNYLTLGLTRDAVMVTESEERDFCAEKIGGLENICWRLQAEFAFNLKIKGYTWDVTNGGIAPNDVAVATGSNWVLNMDKRNSAGVAILAPCL